MTLRRQRVAIVGGGGFIGSRLAQTLTRDGHQVVVLDVRPPPDQNQSCSEFVPCDIRSRDSLRGVFQDCDAVFHLSALLERGCHDDPRLGWEVNLRGIYHVVDELIEAGDTTRLCFFSSARVYARPAQQLPIREDAPQASADLYGLSKMAGERMVEAATRASGIQAVIFRLFTVYGDGPAAGKRGHFIASWLERAMAGEPLTIHGDGQQTVDLTHVTDVVAACRLWLVKADAAPNAPVVPIYNIASGAESSVAQIAHWMAQVVTGLKVEHQPQPGGVNHRLVADIGRAYRGLSYQPQVAPEEGIKSLLRLAIKERSES